MALLWIDGFENYGTTVSTGTSGRPAPTGVVSRRYAIADDSYLRIQDGRFDGRSLRLWYSSSESLRTPSITTDTTIVVGAAIKRMGADNQYIHRLFDDDNLGINILLPGDSTDLIVRNGATVLERIRADIRINRWYFVELKVVAHATTGSYEVRVNGSTVASDSGLDTTASGGLGYYDQVGFTTVNLLGSVLHLDDLYICDGSGTLNTSFLGNKRVVTIRPNDDYAATFTTVEPSGDHYATVDEAECDDATSYIEGATGDKDLFEYADLPADFNSITGLEVNTQVRETDATSFDIITVVRSDGTEYPDSGQAVGDSDYTSRRQLLETDPDTSSAWLRADVNAAQFGLEAS